MEFLQTLLESFGLNSRFRNHVGGQAGQSSHVQTVTARARAGAELVQERDVIFLICDSSGDGGIFMHVWARVEVGG